MKIVLATGIFPPDIGGPATYVQAIARELVARGDDVVVVTYGKHAGSERVERTWIENVGNYGGPLGRWLRYRDALQLHGANADIVCAFSSVSAGIPLMMTTLKKPKKILRLGGDFFWERYTDRGGELGLREWYASRFGFWRILNALLMHRIFRSFDEIVYSTAFQRDLHRKVYGELPSRVVSNALPSIIAADHYPHVPFRLLFMGRFVRFKNISSLIEAMTKLPDFVLTIVGSGPLEAELKARTKRSSAADRITFRDPVSGHEKKNMFDSHDLLVLPSLTEISPNVALEARAMSMPVLLTEETGLTEISDIYRRTLRKADQIADAIRDIKKNYRQPRPDIGTRTYKEVSAELFPKK